MEVKEFNVSFLISLLLIKLQISSEAFPIILKVFSLETLCLSFAFSQITHTNFSPAFKNLFFVITRVKEIIYIWFEYFYIQRNHKTRVLARANRIALLFDACPCTLFLFHTHTHLNQQMTCSGALVYNSFDHVSGRLSCQNFVYYFLFK